MVRFWDVTRVGSLAHISITSFKLMTQLQECKGFLGSISAYLACMPGPNAD